MLNECTIRSYQAGDLPRLHEVRATAFTPVFQSFRSLLGKNISAVALADLEAEQAALLDRICAPDGAHDLFVVEYDGAIIAFCSVTCDRKTKLGEIDLNATHPDYQGMGVGALMYEHALEHMRAAGMKAATVGTGGDESHARARHAYEKAGFNKAIPSIYMYREI